VDVLWATKSEGVGLIVRAISFQDFQPMWSWSTNVTDRETDRQTDAMRSPCALHCVEKFSNRKPPQIPPGITNGIPYFSIINHPYFVPLQIHRRWIATVLPFILV